MSVRHAFCFSVLLAVVASGSPPVLAQEGGFDPSWIGNGRRVIDFSSESDNLYGMQVTSEGKVLLVGACGPDGNACVARLAPDGALDPTFGPSGNGMLQMNEFAGNQLAYPAGIARSSDGSLWLAGTTFTAAQASVVRLNQDGSSVLGTLAFHFDSSATPPGSAVHAFAIAPDQSLVVAGAMLRSSDNARIIGVARLRLDANTGELALDPDFGSNGVVQIDYGSEVNDLLIQADGRILLAGWKRGTAPAGMSSGFVMRLLANGVIDDPFGTAAGLTQLRLCAGSYNSFGSQPLIALDTQGRIAVAYTARYRAPDFTELDSEICVNRLFPDGQQDGSFGGVQTPGGTGHPVRVSIGGSHYLNAIAVGADDKIIVGGENVGVGSRCAVVCFMVARLNKFPRNNTVLDLSFGLVGAGVSRYDDGVDSSNTSAIAIGNGGLMIAGSSYDLFDPFTPPRFGVAKVQLGSAAFDPVFADGFE
jgi:uncharacterized delta-60 repeat protein